MEDIGDALGNAFVSTEGGKDLPKVYNVAEALNKIGDGLYAVAKAIDRLGNADACTPMGGMEALGAVHKEGYELLANAISEALHN